MKKWTLIILAAMLFACTASGCGSRDTANTDSSVPGSAPSSAESAAPSEGSSLPESSAPESKPEESLPEEDSEISSAGSLEESASEAADKETSSGSSGSSASSAPASKPVSGEESTAPASRPAESAAPAESSSAESAQPSSEPISEPSSEASEPAEDTGVTAADIYAAINSAFQDAYGYDAIPTMSMEIDDTTLTEKFRLTSDQVESYAGSIAAVMTNCDELLVVQAKDGQIDAVKAALEQALADQKEAFGWYAVMNNTERLEAAKVVVKGNYAALLIVGTSPDTGEEEGAADFTGDVAMAEKAFLNAIGSPALPAL